MSLNLDAIRARADAATDGPWEADGWEVYGPARRWIAETHDPHNVPQCEADAEFIAAACTDVPALLAEIEEQKAAHARTVDASMTDGWERVAAEMDADALRAEVGRLNRRLDAAHEALTRVEDDDPDEFVTLESTVEWVVTHYRALQRDFDELDRLHHGGAR